MTVRRLPVLNSFFQRPRTDRRPAGTPLAGIVHCVQLTCGLDDHRSDLCQFQTLALGDEKVSKPIVLKSGLGPGQKHNLTAESAEIDAGVDVARSRERETVNHDGMDGAVAK